MRRAPADLAAKIAAAALVAAGAGIDHPTAVAAVSGDPGGAPASAVILAGPGWSDGDRAAVGAAAGRLPAAVRARAPRSIARDALPCQPDGWPDDARLLDDRGGVHLCAPNSNATDATFTSSIDLARQVVTALLVGFDRAAGWSDDPEWRRINGWHASPAAAFALRADNVSPDGFATARGRRSPRWDLATFMAAWLLDGDGPDGGTGDRTGDRAACRLLSQTAFVRQRLGWPPADCAAFESWAAFDRLDAIELVLAAPSTAMVGSLFGHLFVRLVYRDDDGATPPHLSRAVAFLADNDVPFGADPAYALKGIAGFYTASLHERPFLDTYREYVVAEGRDLQRWRVDLAAGERRALMRRLWTASNGGARYTYYFFRSNCATLMLDLLNAARAPRLAVGRPGLLAAPPASALEAWADARGSGEAPLLQPVHDPILSFDHQARLASRRRRQIEPRIVVAQAALAGAPARDAAEAAFRDAHDPAADARAAAYERLAALLAAPDAATDADILAWLRDSAVIESHLSVIANLQAEARADADRRRHVVAVAAEIAAALRREAAAPGQREELGAALRQVDDDAPDVRLAGYRALRGLVAGPAPRVAGELAGRLRLLALLRSEARYDVARMKREPGLRDALLFADADRPIDEQPYLQGRQDLRDLVHLPVETRISAPLRSLQAAKQALFAARRLDRAAPPAGEPEATAVATEARAYDASLPRSGIDQVAVLAGVAADPGAIGAGAAGVVLAGALYDERLGDHRRFGFSSDTAFVVGRSAVLLATSGGRPAFTAYDARLLGYRSLRTPLRESPGGRWPFGWEVYADSEGEKARALAAEVKLGWGLIAPLVERDDLTDHLIAAAGLAYEAYFPGSAARAGAGNPQAIAAPLALELRAGLGAAPRRRSWLAARLRAEPLAVLLGARVRAAIEAGADAEAHLALFSRAGSAHDPALLIRAQLLRTTLTFTGAPAATTALLALGVELR